MDLYQMIFQRKSVRKYDLAPLEPSILKDLWQYIDSLKPLFSDIQYRIGAPQTHKRNMIPMKAPHYLSFYSEEKEGCLYQTGYIMEKIALYLTLKEIGTCWLGFAQPVDDQIADPKGQRFIIMLALGKGRDSIYRTNVQQFQRKKIEEITDVPELYSLLEAVRLAPSGLNRQPWFFSGTKERIHVYREKLGWFKNSVYGKTDQIDLGIALCHLEMSIQKEGKYCIWEWKESETIYKDRYQQICTVHLSDSNVESLS